MSHRPAAAAPATAAASAASTASPEAETSRRLWSSCVARSAAFTRPLTTLGADGGECSIPRCSTPYQGKLATPRDGRRQDAGTRAEPPRARPVAAGRVRRALPQVLRLADVGRRERSVPRALLDSERVVPANRRPRDAGGAEVVESDRLASCVRCEQLGACDAGDLQVLSEEHRSVLVVGYLSKGNSSMTNWMTGVRMKPGIRYRPQHLHAKSEHESLPR
jgi:hypothetical protein